MFSRITHTGLAGVALTAMTIAAGPALAQDRSLTIAISGEVETIDPPFSQFQRSNEVNYNIYDQFFRYGWTDTGDGYSIADVANIEGSAIESLEWSDDGLTLLATLREGAIFPKTGNPVTADDFIYWFERAAGTNAGTQFNVTSSNIVSWSKVSDTQIEVKLSAPSPWLFYLFRDQSQAPIEAAVAKQHATTEDPWATNWLAQNDAGSGEYFVETWDPSVQVVLKANPDYWDEPAYFDEVILQVVPSSANRALLLQQGEVDIAKDLSTDELDLLRSSPDVKILSVPTRNQMILGFNVTKPPFDDAAVRTALNYAVPYEQIVNGLFKGNGLVSAGPIPVQGQYHDASLWSVTTDTAKAKAMLAEAGYADGLSFTVDIADGNTTAEQIAILLQSAFAEAGVTMQINKQAASVFAEDLGTLNHEAWIRDLLWYVDDPGYTGKLFYETGAVANWMGYSNPELDAVIDELAATVDPVRSAELAKRYQELLIADSPSVALVDMPFEIAMRADIEGYVQLPDNLLWYYPLKRAE